MEELEKAILCRLHGISGLGSASLFKIKEVFGSFRLCFEADRKELDASFLTAEIVDKIIALRRGDPLKYLDDLKNRGIEVVTIDEDQYPILLSKISKPPYILYYRGDISIANKFCLAIVGARNCTVYGKKVARDLASSLSAENIVVVSGMARGIDTEAHMGALDAAGKTVAVLGSGVDIVYPRENKVLYDNLVEKGLVMTEFSPGTRPEPGNFPIRNRIISGLSKGIIVVEAQKRSGALITADAALEQGRDVFAVPGAITSSLSEGCNNLIKQGACLVTCYQDILQEYYEFTPKAVRQECQEQELLLLDTEEELVIQCIGYDPSHMDEILSATGLSVGQLSTILLQLELRGLIKSLPGRYWVRIS